MFNTLLNINERVLNQGFWLGQVASLARGAGGQSLHTVSVPGLQTAEPYYFVKKESHPWEILFSVCIEMFMLDEY